MATLMRWDPVQEAMTLREAMNRLFEESFVPNAPGHNVGSFAPALDLSETAEAYLIEAAVPGLKAEDLSITFENGVLTISGEVRQSEESKERNYHRVERRYGSFSRSISLPVTVRGDAIEAKLESGVLHLNIPKAEEVKPRKITVNVS
ncbi:MAG: Hsp20/alpha crystallin family protein [Chloroflexales bacterium]|nr:Hsp20/alpha crystallin family protein [Chloroflexales bacterium]